MGGFWTEWEENMSEIVHTYIHQWERQIFREKCVPFLNKVVKLYSTPCPCVTGYVFENLPGGVFYDLVRVFLSVELTLTFPIVFKPASDVAEEIWYNFLMVRM